MTRPSAETNDPEPPLLKRTDDFWMCSSHLAVGWKSYFSLRILVGGALNSHMPSSAFALVFASVMMVIAMMAERRSWVFMKNPRKSPWRVGSLSDRRVTKFSGRSRSRLAKRNHFLILAFLSIRRGPDSRFQVIR